MTTQQMISNLTKNGATFRIEGTRLAVDAPRGVLGPAERQVLTERKQQVLQLLQREKVVKCERLRPGVWIAWDSPLFGRCTGEVVMSPEKGWLVVRHFRVSGELVFVPEALIVQVDGKSLNA